MAEMQRELNRLAGISGWDAQHAANVLADTSGLDLVGALNVAAGTVGLELSGACRALAARYGGDSGLDAQGALASIPDVIVGVGGGNDLTTEAAALLTTEHLVPMESEAA